MSETPTLEAVLGTADVLATSRIAGDGPTGRLPITPEMLRESPSGDLFGLTQNVGMGWSTDRLGGRQFVIVSTQGGVRDASGAPVALGLHTGHWEIGLLVRRAAETLRENGAIPFATYCSDPCDGRTQGTTGMFDSLAYRNDAAVVMRRLIRSLPTASGVLGIASCDKGLPATMMALAGSKTLPGVVVPGGVTLPAIGAEDAGQIQSLGARFSRDLISLDYAATMGCRACGSSGGGCQFLGTAATSQVVAEALGLALPHSALAPSGEPAVGPVAFMHRASAVNDPMSNITHHWQDATHITFGVVTGAVYGKRWKVEGSVFNGREPDENRWNFDLNGARFSSYAGRFTFNPSNEWSLSASLAHLDGHDEVIHGAVRRASVSVLQSHDFGGGRTIASALVWGANRPTGESAENSFLAETNVELDSKNSVFVRAERVAKSAADLALGTASGVGPYPATGVALGYVREVGTFGVFSTGLGVRGSVTFVPESLESTYGTRHPAGLVAFLRVRPKRMTAAELAEMHEQMRK